MLAVDVVANHIARAQQKVDKRAFGVIVKEWNAVERAVEESAPLLLTLAAGVHPNAIAGLLPYFKGSEPNMYVLCYLFDNHCWTNALYRYAKIVIAF